MRSARSSALVLLMFVFAMRLAAQVKSIDIETPPKGPLGAGALDVVIIAKTTDNSPAGAKALTVSVNAPAQVKKTGEADDKLAASITVTTGADGKAPVTIKPKDKNQDVILTVVSDGTTQTFPWAVIRKFTVDSKMGASSARTIYPDAIVVTAKGKDDVAAGCERMNVHVIGNSDTRVFVDPDAARNGSVEIVTDKAGTATFSVETGNDLETELLIVPLDAEGKEIAVGEKTVKLSGIKTFDTFHSKRLFTELFTGATFTNDYDTNGKSTGFNKTGPLVRATFDTLWYDSDTHRRYSGGLIRGSLLHSGIDMEVSSFPFGQDAKPPAATATAQATTNNDAPKGLDNAFSGAIFTVWQPDKWASYTPTSEMTGLPTDALRWGILAKVGMTTRPNVASNGDTAFWRGQLGIRFTHHQTKVTSAPHEQDNIVPIRFVEVSWARFEEFANQTNANRLVLDAGFRLPGMGSNAIPFYAGIHLNAGRGADDLRIFAGFLFKINELATLFQKAEGQ